jgi:hypothetical protein
MGRDSKQPVVYVAMAAATALILVVLVMVISAERQAHANAEIQKMVHAQTTKAHSDQISWQARLPEIYTFSMLANDKPKKTATSFRYTLVKNGQTMGKEAVVANEVSGPVTVDQSEAAVMPDAFKCFWREPCQAYATDSAGDAIYSSQEANNFNYYYGLVKGKSILRLTTRQAMTQANVLAVVNSLKLASPSEREQLR